MISKGRKKRGGGGISNVGIIADNYGLFAVITIAKSADIVIHSDSI